MGRTRTIAYWLAVAGLLSILYLLATYDQWLFRQVSVPVMSLLLFGVVIVYLEARWINHWLRTRFIWALAIAFLAELVSAFLSVLLGMPVGPNFMWIIASLEPFRDSLTPGAIDAGVLPGVIDLLHTAGGVIVFAIVTESLVYMFALKRYHRPSRLLPVVLSANVISYLFLTIAATALVLLFNIV